jgi:arginase
LIEQASTLGWKVKYEGQHAFEQINIQDDPPQGILKRPKLVSSICKTLSNVVHQHIEEGSLPLTLGGDHSLVGLMSSLNTSAFTYIYILNRLWELSLEP